MTGHPSWRAPADDDRDYSVVGGWALREEGTTC